MSILRHRKGPSTAPSESGPPSAQIPEPLVSPRAALVLLLATLTGCTAASLMFIASGSWPVAALAGGAAAGSAVRFYDFLIGREHHN